MRQSGALWQWSWPAPAAGRALDQPRLQPEAPAQKSFFARHLAGVALVIVAGEVQHAVKEQDLQLDKESMPRFFGLPVSRFHGNSEVAAGRLLSWRLLRRWKRKYVCR